MAAKDRAITVREIKALKLADAETGARAFEADRSISGLGVRYGATDRKMFILRGRVRGTDKTFRWTLGEFVESADSDDFDPMLETPFLTLEQAREKARAFLKQAKNGIDPQSLITQRNEEAARKRALSQANTFSAVVERYLSEKTAQKKLRKLPLRDYERCLRGEDLAALRDRPIAEITDQDIDRVLEAIRERSASKTSGRDGAGVGAVYSTYARLRGLFAWAVKKKYVPIESNPIVSAEKPDKPANRERTLENAEIKVVYPCLDAAGLLGPAFKLLLLTGQRLREICDLETDEIYDLDGDDPRIVLPPARTKNGREHIIPLSPMAVEVLKEALASRKYKNSPYVFSGTGKTPASGYSKAKKQVDDAVALALKEQGARAATSFAKRGPWRLHDLRRTFVTGCNELEIAPDVPIPPQVIEAIVNHVSGVAKAGVAGQYNKAQYMPLRRKTMHIWANHIAGILDPDGKINNVVTLRLPA